MKEYIARVAGSDTKEKLYEVIDGIIADGKISLGLQKNLRALIDEVYKNEVISPLRARVIYLLQIEKRSQKTKMVDLQQESGSTPSEPESKRLLQYDHELALKEINSTIKSYINAISTRISVHNPTKGTNKEPEIISFAQGLNELIDNPEHKPYININNALFSQIFDIQIQLDKLQLGNTYGPLRWLMKSFREEVVTNITEVLLDFCREGNTEGVRYVLKFSKDEEVSISTLFKADRYDLTPLILAAVNGHTEIVKAILETQEGKDSLSIKDKDGYTSLIWAARNSRTEIVKAILETQEGRASLKIQNEYGNTPLIWAAINGHTEIVKAILETQEGRASLSIKNKDGYTPLLCAVIHAHSEVVEVLIAYGAAPSLRDLLNSHCTKEINSLMKSKYLGSWVSTAHDVIGSDIETFIQSAKNYGNMYVDISEFYNKKAKELETKWEAYHIRNVW